MATKNFKNSFGVTSDSAALISAFKQTVNELGWSEQIDTGHSSTASNKLFFQGVEAEVFDLKPNHFWGCGGYESCHTVYTLPAQWNEAVAAASEFSKPKDEIKVGDWVVVLPTDRYYANALQGVAQRVAAVKKPPLLPYTLEFPGSHTNSYREVRKATAKEIAEASVIDVAIGKGDTKASIRANGTIHAGGRSISYESIAKLYHWMGSSLDKELPWLVTVTEVTIGCTEGVTREQLGNVLKAYNTLNK